MKRGQGSPFEGPNPSRTPQTKTPPGRRRGTVRGALTRGLGAALSLQLDRMLDGALEFVCGHTAAEKLLLQELVELAEDLAAGLPLTHPVVDLAVKLGLALLGDSLYVAVDELQDLPGVLCFLVVAETVIQIGEGIVVVVVGDVQLGRGTTRGLIDDRDIGDLFALFLPMGILMAKVAVPHPAFRRCLVRRNDTVKLPAEPIEALGGAIRQRPNLRITQWAKALQLYHKGAGVASPGRPLPVSVNARRLPMDFPCAGMVLRSVHPSRNVLHPTSRRPGVHESTP